MLALTIGKYIIYIQYVNHTLKRQMLSLTDNDQHYLCHTGDRQPFTISHRLLQMQLIYLFVGNDQSKQKQ